MKEQKTKMSLAKRVMISLILGLVFGIGIIFLRENLLTNGNEETWNTIFKYLFADISAEGNESALGIFYIIGQLFVRSLQVIIVPMVFTSIILAIISISDASKLGRISGKTLLHFSITTALSLVTAGIVGFFGYKLGFFNANLEGLSSSTGATGSNPLMILINAFPSNLISAFSNNGGILAVVVVAAAVGLVINASKEKIEVLPKLCKEISNIITIALTFIVDKFAPIAIFCLITRTFAVYGINFLKPAAAYMIVTTILLLGVLIFGYAFYVWANTRLNPITYIKKVAKVAMFGFSTSSSAATLPLNIKTTTEELGVEKEIASFVLPLGMTVNMNGTAIMQVIAAIFIASCGGYDVTFASIFTIGLLAIVASIGTPAAPGAGAVVLFTILTGMGYANEPALMAYTLILAINRPIEMLVTSLNVVGDSTCSVIIAKNEGLLDEETYNSTTSITSGQETVA